MVSLARSNLLYDWHRSLAVISILALLGSLILVQVGMPMAMIKSFMRSYTDNSADLFATGEKARYFGYRSLSSRQEGFIWMHENVKLVETPARQGRASLFIDDDNSINVSVLPVNAELGSLSFPNRLGEDVRQILAVPGNIIVSNTTRKNYDLKLHSRITLKEFSVVVAGFVDDLGEVFSRTHVMLSLQTARMLDLMNSRDRHESYLIKLHDSSKLVQTQEELNAYLRNFGILVHTSQEIIDNAQKRFLMRSGAKQNIFIAIFALIIGITVATQTMRSGVLAQIPQYGAMRALGVGITGIAKTLIEQSFWTGLASIPAMIGLSYLVKYVIGHFSISLAFPPLVIISCSMMLMFVAMLAGLLSLPVLYRAQPAELMR